MFRVVCSSPTKSASKAIPTAIDLTHKTTSSDPRVFLLTRKDLPRPNRMDGRETVVEEGVNVLSVGNWNSTLIKGHR